VPDLLAQYRQHFDKLVIPTPRSRRWPVRIPLNEFADALVERRANSLPEYATRQAGEVVPINKVDAPRVAARVALVACA
jgi:hypothetical protein